MNGMRVLRVLRDPPPPRGSALLDADIGGSVSTIHCRTFEGPAMSALLRATELHYAGRTWIADPPLALPIGHDAWGYYVAIPDLALVARARTMAILPVALAVSLSLLWDSTARSARHALTPPAEAAQAFALLIRLRERFTERAGRRLHVPMLDVPICPETCQGGAACSCGRRYG